MELKDLRTPLADRAKGLPFDESISDPFEMLNQWLNIAIEKKLVNPNAMGLSTVDSEGFPNTRQVLLKGIEDQKLIFFTNFDSDKGAQLSENKKVSLNFYWRTLERQVRIRGIAEKMSEKVGADYFHSRPRSSQIAAVISPQSRVIENRQWLLDEFARFEAEYQDKEIPAPKNWGGYGVTAEKFEFWQGQRDRLHDRILFSKTSSGWEKVRLAP